MNVTQAAICPSQASQQAGRPALTPELLAACGARYSRNNEGLQAILSKIDPLHLEKSVDAIFRMVDYGHQSIADMVPVAMFMDGISIWLAYYLWTLCPTAGGQESSTRYIKIAVDGLIAPETLGLAEAAAWRELMAECFRAYQSSVAIWEDLAAAQPGLMGIPQSLLDDPSETARKKVMRLKRNYAFDRARYFLPVAAATNVMLLMSARGWVNLCQFLLSHPLPEARQLGGAIHAELALPAPRMLKHARDTEPVRQAIAAEFEKLVQLARAPVPGARDAGALPSLAVMPPAGITAAGHNGHASLSWSPSVGATPYYVKRSTVAGGAYTPAGSVAGTGYVDTGLVNGTAYYYVVAAGNSAGTSGNSVETKATPVAAISLTLSPQLQTGGFSFSFTGQSNQSFVVETSTNLMDWMAVLTNVSADGQFIFSGVNATDSARYYRVRQ